MAFPLFGVVNHRAAAADLGSHIILVLLGGFLMVKALEKTFACSIGGIATLIGTPPNFIVAGIYKDVFGQEFGFLRWLKNSMAISMVALPIAWFWLTHNIKGGESVELPKMTVWSTDQKRGYQSLL